MNIRIVNRLVLWLAAAYLCLSVTDFAAAQAPANPQAKAKQGGAAARGRTADAKVRPSDLAPTFENASYGPDASNKIDFWKATIATPAPLVVFIHGGGFRAGDKAQYDKPLLTA